MYLFIVAISAFSTLPTAEDWPVKVICLKKLQFFQEMVEITYQILSSRILRGRVLRSNVVAIGNKFILHRLQAISFQ